MKTSKEEETRRNENNIKFTRKHMKDLTTDEIVTLISHDRNIRRDVYQRMEEMIEYNRCQYIYTSGENSCEKCNNYSDSIRCPFHNQIAFKIKEVGFSNALKEDFPQKYSELINWIKLRSNIFGLELDYHYSNEKYLSKFLENIDYLDNKILC